MQRLIVLVLLLGPSAACSSTPSQGDTGSAPDLGSTDSGASLPDLGTDATSPLDVSIADTGSAVDTGASHRPCNGTCSASQVCCAATGPGGDQCTASTACTSGVRCVTTADCSGGIQCCTDGIQSTCGGGGICADRACLTASDCTGTDVCCPFGTDQSACRPAGTC